MAHPPPSPPRNTRPTGPPPLSTKGFSLSNAAFSSDHRRDCYPALSFFSLVVQHFFPIQNSTDLLPPLSRRQICALFFTQRTSIFSFPRLCLGHQEFPLAMSAMTLLAPPISLVVPSPLPLRRTRPFLFVCRYSAACPLSQRTHCSKFLSPFLLLGEILCFSIFFPFSSWDPLV